MDKGYAHACANSLLESSPPMSAEVFGYKWSIAYCFQVQPVTSWHILLFSLLKWGMCSKFIRSFPCSLELSQSFATLIFQYKYSVGWKATWSILTLITRSNISSRKWLWPIVMGLFSVVTKESVNCFPKKIVWTITCFMLLFSYNY